MIHYDIDFTIDNVWHHTFGESTFPSDENYDKRNYTPDDIKHNAKIIIDAYMDMGHLCGYVNPNDIKVCIAKI